MLQAMRGGAKSPIMKVFLVFLAAGFALWGVGDMTTGLIGGSDKAISAGEESRSPREVAMEFERTRRSYMPGASTGEALQAGLLSELASIIARDVVFQAEATTLGLTVTRAMQRDAVATQPAFKDEFGNFSETRFLSALTNAGISEAEYLSRVDTDLRRSQIVDALSAGVSLPDVVAQTLTAFELERRSAALVSVQVDAAAVTAPDDGTLSSWYETTKSRYDAPALRSARVGLITPAMFAAGIEISEDDVVAAFEDRLDDYAQPETRAIRQMVFENDADANTAIGRIGGGESFEAVAADMLGLSEGDLQLGTLAAADLDPVIADAAFSIDAGETTGPVESPFGFHVLVVDAINEGTTVSLDDVRESLVAALQTEAATDLIYEKANVLEDKIASGATLEESIAEVGGDIVSLANIDRGGRDIDGAPANDDIADIAQDSLVLDVVWSSEIGEPGVIQEGTDDMFFIVEVLDETEPRERSLSEVKQRAIDDWKLVEAIRIAREEAEALAAKEESFAGVEPTSDFRRNGSGLDHEAARLIASAAFGQAVGETTVVETGREAIALRTEAILAVDAEELENTSAIAANFITSSIQQDVLNTLARDLSQTHDLQIRLGGVQQLLVGTQN